LSFIFILGSGHSICENAHLFGKTALLKLSMQEMPQKVRKVMPQNRSISVWYLFYSMNLNEILILKLFLFNNHAAWSMHHF